MRVGTRRGRNYAKGLFKYQMMLFWVLQTPPPILMPFLSVLYSLNEYLTHPMPLPPFEVWGPLKRHNESHGEVQELLNENSVVLLMEFGNLQGYRWVF